MLVPICCGALAFLGATAGPFVLVGTLFAPLVMAPVALLLLVLSGYVNAKIMRSATGRRGLATAVVLALLVPAGVVAEVAAQAEIPLSPRHGVPVPVLIGAVAAGISTFVLGTRARFAGGVVILLVVAVYVW